MTVSSMSQITPMSWSSPTMNTLPRTASPSPTRNQMSCHPGARETGSVESTTPPRSAVATSVWPSTVMLTSACGTGAEVKLRQPRIFRGAGESGPGRFAMTTLARTRTQVPEPYPRNAMTWGTCPRDSARRTRQFWNQSSTRAARWMTGGVFSELPATTTLYCSCRKTDVKMFPIGFGK